MADSKIPDLGDGVSVQSLDLFPIARSPYAPGDNRYLSAAELQTWVGTFAPAASFTRIAVSGQSDIVADTISDTLTIAAGANITLTTNAGTDTLTIAASGGSGSPGGTDGQFQYNDGGSFGGTPLVYDDTGGFYLAVGGFGLYSPDGDATLAAQSISLNGGSGTDVANPNGANVTNTAGNSFSGAIGASFRTIAGMGSDGGDQEFYAGQGLATGKQGRLRGFWPDGSTGYDVAPNTGVLWNKFKLSPGNGTAVVADGGTATTAATISHPALATTRWQTRNQRFLSTTTAATAQVGGSRGTYANIHISSTSGLGGCRAEFIFTITVNTTGHQAFFGICASTAALAGDPSALTNMVGMGYDAADTSGTNWFLMNNDGSGTATRTSLGANFARNTTDSYRMILWWMPGSLDVYYDITNLETGNVTRGQITSDRPGTGNFLSWKAEVRTGATTTAAAPGIHSVTIDWPMN